MSPLALALMILGLMLGLMALRVPIAIAMLVAGVAGYVTQAGWGPLLNHLNSAVFARFSSYDLSVIPLFILMGNFATQGGISRALFAFASQLLARFQGGLAMAAVLASAAFGAICGSSVATAATITSVALPEMRRHGYGARLATGTLAAGGTLGILIPPSVPLVIYAILAEQNIARLFAAAIIPGLIAMLGYMLAITIYVRLVPTQAPAQSLATARLSLRSWLAVLPIVLTFTLVVGGIYAGLFTPTEGAAVGATGTFVAALAQRELDWGKIQRSFLTTAESSAMIFMIFIGADVLNSALALTQISNQISTLVSGSGLAPMWVMAAILLFYVLAGSVMDELSLMLLTIPIFFPIVIGLDYGMARDDVAIWFGILVLMTVGIGMLAPPVGLNVYVVNAMARGVPLAESYRGVLPFLASDILRLLLLLLFPAVTLWLLQFVR